MKMFVVRLCFYFLRNISHALSLNQKVVRKKGFMIKNVDAFDHIDNHCTDLPTKTFSFVINLSIYLTTIKFCQLNGFFMDGMRGDGWCRTRMSRVLVISVSYTFIFRKRAICVAFVDRTNGFKDADNGTPIKTFNNDGQIFYF